MSDALSFAEIDSQHVELLPARTVLSLFTVGGHGDKVNNCSTVMKNNLNIGVPILNDLLGILSPGDDSTSVGQSATTNCSNQ